MIQAGRLRHRTTIQEKVGIKTPSGATTDEWFRFATVWASVEPLTGREFFAAKEINAEVTTRIRLRYRTDIKPTMRILFRDQTFDILSIINSNNQNRELTLMCKETGV